MQQVDRPLRCLLADPVNRFVAGFVGWPPMNFLDGEIASEDGELVFRRSAGRRWRCRQARWMPGAESCRAAIDAGNPAGKCAVLE